MSIQLLFPSDALRHALDSPTDVSPPYLAKSPSVKQGTPRAEWLIARAIAVATLILVVLFIGPPHVV